MFRKIAYLLQQGLEETLELENADLHFDQKQRRAKRLAQASARREMHRDADDFFDAKAAQGYKLAGGREF